MILSYDWLLSREECMRQEVIGDALVDGKELRGKSAAAMRIKWRGRTNWQGYAGIVECGEMRGISPHEFPQFRSRGVEVMLFYQDWAAVGA